MTLLLLVDFAVVFIQVIYDRLQLYLINLLILVTAHHIDAIFEIFRI